MDYNILISLCFIFFEVKTWRGPLLPGTRKFTSSHYDQVIELTQIPQVVMNIDYKLEPIADKNDAAYFHDLDFNSFPNLVYHFKNLCVFRLY